MLFWKPVEQDLKERTMAGIASEKRRTTMVPAARGRRCRLSFPDSKQDVYHSSGIEGAG